MNDTTVLKRQLSGLPDLLKLHALQPERYPFLLESAAHGTAQGRYSILFAFPGEVIESGPGKNFFDCLDADWRQQGVAQTDTPDPLPFTGGWFLYLGYEAAGLVEPHLQLPKDPGQPAAWAVRVPAGIILDHIECCTWLVTEPDQPERLDIMQEALSRAESGERSMASGELLRAPLEEEAPAAYCQAVEAAKQYIHDGDVFQANLSRAWTGELRADLDPVDVYRRLRQSNPGPFAGLARRGDRAIISSSPERLVSRRGNRVDTRPIAGTRPRGDGRDPDEALRQELIGHPKERAEHIMLIDLERNDLGRICTAGSVEVSELMVLESYAHVHHIVSNVRGEVRPDISPGEILQAVFPGGTITGCPKVRCMEIIGELEGRPRGAYTGALGYLNRDGSLDSNILIRTMETRGQSLRLLAGAGIVADSIPERELDETRAKARGMILALQDTA